MVDSLMKDASVQAIARAIRGSDYEQKVWLVGGCVRDSLLELQDLGDIDITVEGSAEDLVHHLVSSHSGFKLIASYERFGTELIRFEDKSIEVVGTRKESYRSKSRKPEVHPATLEEDARRRDFTCNSIYLNVSNGALYDPLSGVVDIQKKVLRPAQQASGMFEEDPLRLLRAVRFRNQLGFEYEAGLDDEIARGAVSLSNISAERIRDEIAKMITFPNAVSALEDLMRLDLLDQFLPELRTMKDCEQGGFHHLDVWDHSLLVLANAATKDLKLALSCLLHDVAKPQTKSVDDEGRIRFFGHDVASAEMAQSMLRRLRFDEDTIRSVHRLVKNHMRLGQLVGAADGAYRRLVVSMEGDLDRLFLLCESDVRALRPGLEVLDIQSIRKRLDSVLALSAASQWRSPLTGSDLMEEFQQGEGKWIGEVQSHLIALVLDGALEPHNKEAGLRAARDFLMRAETDSSASQ